MTQEQLDAAAVIAVTDVMESHVNCRCTMVPRAKSYAELLGDPSLEDKRVAMDTGPQAFAQLTPAQQLSILGPGKFALYQRGLPLEAMYERVYSADWGVSRTAIPLYRLQKQVAAGKWKLRPDVGNNEQLDLWANPRELGDHDELSIWAKPLWAPLKGQLTDDQMASLAAYKASGYHSINGYLRNPASLPNYGAAGYFGPYGDPRDHIDNIQLAIMRTRVTETIQLFRGAGSGSAFGIHSVMTYDEMHTQLTGWIGREWADPGFLSTAAVSRSAFGGRVFLNLTLPKGHPALPLADPIMYPHMQHNENISEAELLLPRGTRVVIDRVERRDQSNLGLGDRWVLHGRILPYQEPA